MIILSMLGTGNYQATRYKWGDRECETHLVPVALASWLPDSEVKVLVTNEANEKHGHALREAVPRGQLIRIPSGKSQDELWTIFNTVAENIPTGAQVLLDITHALRSLPTLVLLSMAFLRIAKAIDLKHVLYGAFEAKDVHNATPVFDLTPFVAMLDWANATDRFLETGDARKISPLISEKSMNPLNGVAGGLRNLSEAFVFMRAEQIQECAVKLSRMIADAKTKAWSAHQAPLKLLLDRIELSTEPMSYAIPLQAQWNQIGWLAQHSHYPAAASLIREWMVSVRVLISGCQIFPVDREHREACEIWLNQEATKLRSGSGDAQTDLNWIRFLNLWDQINQLRNDVMHFGMRQGARPPSRIAKEVHDGMDEILAATRSLGLDVANQSRVILTTVGISLLLNAGQGGSPPPR